MVTISVDMSQWDPNVTGWGKWAKNTTTGTTSPRYIDFRRNGNEYEIVVTSQKVNFAPGAQKIGQLTLIAFQLRNAHTFEADRDTLKKAFKELNDKVVQIRNSYCPPMRFLLSLFHDLPCPVQSFSLRHPERGLGRYLIPYRYQEHNDLPFSSAIVESLSVNSVRDTLGTEHHFCSWQGRLNCLLQAIKGIAFAIFSSLLLPIFAILDRKEFQWKNVLHAVVDVIYSMVLTPCIATVFSIKMLAAAIFHPGIVYRPL